MTDEIGGESEVEVRVRGIYATALTRLLSGEERSTSIVDASSPIQRRFDVEFAAGPADVDCSTTHDRQGVGLSGAPAGVETVRERLAGVAVDALDWPDPAPLGAVCNGVVAEDRGGGAGVDLPGGASGYLPYDAADGYVSVGDRLRVQVAEPAPPWDDFDPKLRAVADGDDDSGDVRVRVERGLVVLERGGSGVRADVRGDDATALARTTELLDAEPPEGWSLRWQRSAVDASHAAMDEALASAAADARDLDEAIADAPTPDDEAPYAVATPLATAWVWFGRESRFALDAQRRAVETTLPGHHRIKAADESASLGVDLAEALAADASSVADEEASVGDGASSVADDAASASDGSSESGTAASDASGTAADAFPFGAVASTLGPQRGDSLSIEHGKPDGRLYTLGRGEVTEYDREGAITLRREIRGSGEYDALGTPREPGDAAVSKLTEGRWWYPTTYRGEGGERKGTYVNVCTPLELFPDSVRYVDLHVDVIRLPDGEVRLVDEDELAAAVEDGDLNEELAERARSVAKRVERALS